MQLIEGPIPGRDHRGHETRSSPVGTRKLRHAAALANQPAADDTVKAALSTVQATRQRLPFQPIPPVMIRANTFARSPGSASRPPRPSTMPTKTASSTATSSRPTCWWTTPASSGSPTSAWPASKRRRHDDDRRPAGHAAVHEPRAGPRKRVVVDHRSDIYSLGVTLYELLTLEPAFAETDRAKLLQQIAFDEPRPLRKIDATSRRIWKRSSSRRWPRSAKNAIKRPRNWPTICGVSREQADQGQATGHVESGG